MHSNASAWRCCLHPQLLAVPLSKTGVIDVNHAVKPCKLWVVKIYLYAWIRYICRYAVSECCLHWVVQTPICACWVCVALFCVCAGFLFSLFSCFFTLFFSLFVCFGFILVFFLFGFFCLALLKLQKGKTSSGLLVVGLYAWLCRGCGLLFFFFPFCFIRLS